MKSLLLFILLSLIQIVTFAQGWQPIGEDDANQASLGSTNFNQIAVDKNGIVYTAYTDWAQGKKITVTRFVNGIWEVVGTRGFSKEEALYVDIQVDQNGIPYVAFQDEFASKQVTVMKFQNNQWVNVGNPGFSTSTVFGEAFYIHLELDNYNNPYVSYLKLGTYPDLLISVAKFSQGSWSILGANTIPKTQANYDFKVSKNNIPYLAIVDPNASFKASVYKYTNNWTVVGTSGVSEKEMEYITLDIDISNGIDVPYISFWDNVRGNAVMKFDGTWNYIGPPIYDGGFPYILAKNGEVYLTISDYSKNYKASVLKYSNNTWNYIGERGFTQSNYDYLSNGFTISDAGTLLYASANNAESNYTSKLLVMEFSSGKWTTLGSCGLTFESCIGPNSVMFNDTSYTICTKAIYSSYNYQTAVLKYNSKKWDTVGTFNVANSYSTNLITVNNIGEPYIMCMETSSNTVSVKKFSMGSWTTISPLNFSNAPATPLSMKFDRNGVLNVSYVETSPYGFGEPDKSIVFKRYDNGVWQFVTSIDGLHIPNYTTNFDSNGIPYILNRFDNDNGQIRLSKFYNNSWVRIDSLPTTYFDSFSIKFDNDDEPILSYKLINNTHILKRINNVLTEVGSFSCSVYYRSPSFEFDKNNVLHVLYSDGSLPMGRASLQKYVNGSWQYVGQSQFTFGDAAQCNLLFNTANVPIVIYNDRSLFALKFDALQTQQISGLAPFLTSETVNNTLTITGVQASSGLPISYTSSDNSIAIINNNVISFVGAGMVTITANQIGNRIFDPAPSANQTIFVEKSNQTILGFADIGTKIFDGNSITFPGLGSSSGLPVTLISSDTSIAFPIGNILKIRSIGFVTITASQIGSINYYPADNVVRALEIIKGNQTIIGFNPISSQTIDALPITIAGIAATSGLPITFTSSDISVASVVGNIITLLSPGITTITASQFGDNNYHAAASLSYSLSILKENQTINGFALINNISISGLPQSISFTATATSGLPVNYALETSPDGIASLNENVLTLHDIGLVTVTASQIGDINYNAASNIIHSFLVLTISGTENVNTAPGNNITLTGTASIPGINTSTGFVFTTMSPMLHWSTVPGAISYCIELATDTSFSTLLYSVCGIVDTFYVLPSALFSQARMESITYYWKTAATFGSVQGDWSKAGSFSLSAINGINASIEDQVVFEVYPNPSQGSFKIVFKNQIANSCQVYNSLGQHITTLKAGEATLPPGLYLLRSYRQIKKLVIE